MEELKVDAEEITPATASAGMAPESRKRPLSRKVETWAAEMTQAGSSPDRPRAASLSG